MAFLTILFLLFSFVFLGVGSGSNGTSSLPMGTRSWSSSTVCVDVTWRKGQPAHKRRCDSTSRGSGSVHARAVVKCSARMTTGGQTRQRCGPPPANP